MLNIKKYLNIKILAFLFFIYSPMAYSNVQFEELKINNDNDIVFLNEEPITIVEFFSYDCLPCYEMNPLIEELVNKYPNQVSLKRFPFVTQDTVDYSKAFFTFTVWKKFKDIYKEKLHNELYKEVLFENNVNIFSIYEEPKKKYSSDIPKKHLHIKEFLKQFNLDHVVYQRIFEGVYSQNMTDRAFLIRENYNINHIPLYIINNKYVFSPKINGSYENTIKSMTNYIENYSSKN